MVFDTPEVLIKSIYQSMVGMVYFLKMFIFSRNYLFFNRIVSTSVSG